LVSTEVLREGDAREVLAPLALSVGNVVEDDGKGGEDEHGNNEANHDENRAPGLAVGAPVKGDVWHESVGEQEAGKEADNVGVVVDPRQQADQNEDTEDDEELAKR